MEMILENLPMALCVLLGMGLILVEVFLPGFGLPGISGIVLLTVGMIAMEPSPLQALVLVLIIVLMLGAAFSVAMHSFSKGRLSKSKLVLSESLDPKAENDDDLDYFVGKTGTTHTALRPAGIAEFDGVKLNVVSDGDFVAAQRPIRVERVEGNRIVVREIGRA